MPFTPLNEISPHSGFAGPQAKLRKTVRMSVTSPTKGRYAATFAIAGDVADELEWTAGDRVSISVGTGEHLGKIIAYKSHDQNIGDATLFFSGKKPENKRKRNVGSPTICFSTSRLSDISGTMSREDVDHEVMMAEGTRVLMITLPDHSTMTPLRSQFTPLSGGINVT